MGVGEWAACGRLSLKSRRGLKRRRTLFLPRAVSRGPVLLEKFQVVADRRKLVRRPVVHGQQNWSSEPDAGQRAEKPGPIHHAFAQRALGQLPSASRRLRPTNSRERSPFETRQGHPQGHVRAFRAAVGGGVTNVEIVADQPLIQAANGHLDVPDRSAKGIARAVMQRDRHVRLTAEGGEAHDLPLHRAVRRSISGALPYFHSPGRKIGISHYAAHAKASRTGGWEAEVKGCGESRNIQPRTGGRLHEAHQVEIGMLRRYVAGGADPK